MTRAEAAAARYSIAGRVSLDTRAVLRCAERGEGCAVRAFGTPLTPEQNATASTLQLADYAGNAWPCAKHVASRRHAWVLDVSIEDFMAHAAEQGGGGAWEIDGLRKYLPKRHLEHRP